MLISLSHDNMGTAPLRVAIEDFPIVNEIPLGDHVALTQL